MHEWMLSEPAETAAQDLQTGQPGDNRQKLGKFRAKIIGPVRFRLLQYDIFILYNRNSCTTGGILCAKYCGDSCFPRIRESRKPAPANRETGGLAGQKITKKQQNPLDKRENSDIINGRIYLKKFR